MRLIDADALKRELGYTEELYKRRKIRELIDNAPTVCNDNYAMGYQDGVKKVLSERLQDDWIPVSEKLPDNTDEYLVNDADGNFGVGYYREDAKAWDSYNWGWLERANSTDDTCPPGMGKVIAWKPLPKAYKAVENETDN